MLVTEVTLCLLFLGILFGIFIIWNRELIYISIKTAKRDVSGIVGYLRTEWGLYRARTQNMTVNKYFDATANQNPNRICCHFENEGWTFAEIQNMTNRVANYFLTQNIQRGETIGLFMENRPEYICLWLGLAKIGLVPALINTNLRLNALEHCLKAANAKAIIFGHELSEAVAEMMADGGKGSTSLVLYKFGKEEQEEDSNLPAVNLRLALEYSLPADVRLTPAIGFHDNLFYIYTSGTTGLPKAAIIKHSRYLMVATGSRRIHGIGKNDVVYTALPLYHSAGNIIGLGHALLFGSTVVFRKKFSATNFWKDCIKYDVTAIQYIGEICRYLIAQPPKPEDTQHKVRLMFGNGLRKDIWTEFLTRFNISQVREFYGSTEGNCNLASCDNQVGSVGFIPRWALPINFYPVVLVKVDQSSGELLRNPVTGLALRCNVGESGELVGVIKKGDPIKDFQGYTDENSQKKKMVRDILKKGDAAFRSGDILVMDKFGYFYFKDRQGDTFRWKGENVSTAEVEAVISRVGGMRDSAVYGVKIPGADGRAGMASIVDPEGTLDLVTLAREFKNQLPPYARPIFLRILKEMDITGTFKIKKVDLQNEGFDIRNIDDKIYFLSNGNFVPLERPTFEGIMSGTVRI